MEAKKAPVQAQAFVPREIKPNIDPYLIPK